ncbi:hypothetical protein [Paracoccus sphaerophysae]|uniref:hypothetical protein n=1 Tax=Paracoccus sphaerophysae TaxID=690417 RepID=UPI0012EC94DC|nr:hypothetical protein [Paracoccus sphaerophysae]
MRDTTDLFITPGGIDGCGIARNAAGACRPGRKHTAMTACRLSGPLRLRAAA